MRWLLLKDLQILRRSPLVVALLVAYPIVVALLIGFALSGGPDKPRVAFLNEVPPGESTVQIGDDQVDAAGYARKLFEAIEPIRVTSRQEAIDKVRSGEALGALIVPRDTADKLRNALSLSGSPERPEVEVIYNVEDPVKARFVESTIKSRLADANQALSGRLTEASAGYLGILLRGGSFSLFGQKIDILGLARSEQILERQAARQPRGSEQRRELERVARFAGLAVANLDLSDDILAAIGEPVKVKRTILDGEATPLDSFAVAVSVTVSLMFVCVLLAAAMLALEREEHAFGRLVRGLVTRLGLVTEKVALAAMCAFALAVVMVAGLSIFVDIAWSQAPLWLLALAAGALAFSALGVAVGALAREVRAASLLAFLLALPVAFLALVPSGTVTDTLYDVIQAISAAFPFKPTLEALDATLNDTGDSILGPLAHLAALAAAYVAIARVAVRRLG